MATSIREALTSQLRAMAAAGGAAVRRWVGVPEIKPPPPGVAPPPPSDPFGQVHREGSARVTLPLWTPDAILAAEVTAAAGNPRLAADLCRQLLGDDRVAGVLNTRVRGLIGLPMVFEASGDRRRARSAVKALEVDEDWWAMFDEADLIEVAKWGILLGLGLGQLTWTVGPSGRLIGKLTPWDPRWLRYDETRRTWVVMTDSGVEVPITPGDGRWVLYAPGGMHRPTDHGAWRPISRWWLLKWYAINDWGRFGEVKAGGIFVGQENAAAVSTGSLSPLDRQKLAAQLNNLGRDTAVILPKGIDLKLIEATADTWKTFDAQVNASNSGIAVAIAGQNTSNLGSSGASGSYATAYVLQDIAGDIVASDNQTLGTCLHDQVLTWWAAINFGDAGLAAWPSWDIEPANDVKAFGDSLKSLGDGITSAMAAAKAANSDAANTNAEPIVIDVRQIYLDHDIPLLEATAGGTPKVDRRAALKRKRR